MSISSFCQSIIRWPSLDASPNTNPLKNSGSVNKYFRLVAWTKKSSSENIVIIRRKVDIPSLSSTTVGLCIRLSKIISSFYNCANDLIEDATMNISMQNTWTWWCWLHLQGIFQSINLRYGVHISQFYGVIAVVFWSTIDTQHNQKLF